jgi:RNA polymerase sigma-70 factor (ECF subfamily)
MMPPVLPRVALGDPVAVRECIARYGGLVFSIARRFFSAPSDAEDAVQEAFIELWRSAAKFDPNLGAEVTFVATVARRRFIDRRRRSARQPPTELLDEGLAAAASEGRLAPELGAEAALCARALAQLRPEQQRVLGLIACQGLSHEEVAAATGMPLGTVKAHARRGLMQIRAALGEPPGQVARMEVVT